MITVNHNEELTFRKTALAVFLLIYAIGALIYGHCLSAPFYFDDMESIVENPHVRITRPVSSEKLEKIVKEEPGSRLLPIITFGLNHYFDQYQPGGYRLVNMIIHLINSWLVFCLAWQTLRLCGKAPFFISLASGLIWLTIPVHTQSVTYIVQRMNSLAAMFYLLALLCYIQARQHRLNGTGVRVILFWSGGCLLAGILGLASKETTATLPLFILLYDRYFFYGSKRSGLTKNWRIPALVVLLFGLIAIVYLGCDPVEKLAATYADKPFSPVQRLLTEPLVIVYYLSLLAFAHPDRLTLDYDFPLSNAVTDPTVNLLAYTALTFLFIMMFYATRKNRLISFALLWFFGNLLIESSVVGLALIFEHRTYLPSIFPVIALVVYLTDRLSPRPLAIAVISAIIICNSFWTFQRNITWQNRTAFWEDGCKKAPMLTRPHNNFGLALAKAGDQEAAKVEYQKAIALSGGKKAPPYNNLGMLLYLAGNTDNAIEHFLKAIETEPDFAKAYMNLGVIRGEQKSYRQAIRLLETAIALHPDNSEAHNALGKIYYESGQTHDAIRHCQLALKLDQSNANAENNLGAILLGTGRAEQALPHLTRAISLSPEVPETNINIGLAYKQLGNPIMAVFHLFRAVYLAPEYAAARAELGLFLLDEGKYQDARTHLEKAIALQPDLVKARLGLASVFENQNLTDEAIRQYQKIIADHPDIDIAHERLKALEKKTEN